ncbi:STAS domain-containing protein [Streptomyces sp. NPDC052236]|uniref:STAS domain-containing protein n=1 Tax=Streptomyces sp. NPDC052236 TaxID=3365686 RepID=UPI0037D8D25E
MTLAGELEHDSAQALREVLADTLLSRTARVLVDCADLRFCDSSGLNARPWPICSTSPARARSFTSTEASMRPWQTARVSPRKSA